MKNPYEVLGLSVNATDSEIKSTFRKLARMTHPDLSKRKPTTNYSFHEIAKAYILLSDPIIREKLDLILKPNDEFNEKQIKLNIDNINLQAQELEYYIHLLHKQVNPYKEKAYKYIIAGVIFLIIGVLMSVSIYFLLNKNIITFFTITLGVFLGMASFYKYHLFSAKLIKAESEIWENLDF